MFQQLQPRIGFGWTTRCIGFVVLAPLAFPLVTLRKFVKESPPRALIDKSALKEWPFVLTLPAMFLVFAGLYVPYFYIEVFSVRTGVASEDLNKYLIVFMNVGSLVGRVVCMARW
jgi:predicted MFS family arabinose efflux permease